MLKNLKNKLNDNKGFSLVELIVVIAIMVILIALLVPNVVGYIQKAQESANLAAAKSIYNAASTAVVDQKAQTGAWPTADTLANTMKAGGLVVVPKGTSAGIEYDAATGAVKSVWVCTGTELGTDKTKYQAYSPTLSGNAAADASYAAVATFALKCVDGGDWIKA